MIIQSNVIKLAQFDKAAKTTKKVLKINTIFAYYNHLVFLSVVLCPKHTTLYIIFR
jgi:hypothetical protein